MVGKRQTRRRVDRRYVRYRSLQPQDHYAVAGVFVWHRIDAFEHLPLISSQVYLHGAVALLMRGGDREPGNLPYELSSIWINPALHRRLIRQDENEPELIVPRTKVNPGLVVPLSNLTPGTIDHWFCVDLHPSLMVMRHNKPGFVILPPNAYDRIPEVVVKLVQLNRANKRRGLQSAAPPQNIEEEIANLIENANRIRPRF